MAPSTIQQRDDESLLAVMVNRRDQLKARLVLAALMLVSFGGVAGWGFAGSWFVVYAGLQLLEAQVFRTSQAVLERKPLAISFIMVGPIAFGVMPMAAPYVAGPWGAPCTAIAIAGLLINSAVGNRRSRIAFRASLVGPVLYSLALPVVVHQIGSPLPHTLALAATVVLNLVGTIRMWRMNYGLLQSEQSAIAAKEAVIAVVAHELRTPISAILAATSELERHAEPGVRGRARLIGDAGGMMHGLLNDLLDRSKLDAGRLGVEAIEFDLRALMGDQMTLWRAEARRNGLRLTLDASRACPALVMGDPTRLRQVLNNLISNAIKFTSHGGVHVRVACDSNDGQHHLRFEVRDTGPGLTPDEVARLFTPFDQLQGSVARNHGGSGLGLALSKDLAGLMGGALTVTSEQGQGAAFTLSLVLPAGQGRRPEGLSTVRGRVLVVDDHDINRRAMRLILESLDLEVHERASAAEALALLADEPFDVVLMDCYMPGMDGRTAAARLRAQPGPNRQAPVIAVTASDTDDDISACRAAGMAWHVAKPIVPARLITVVTQALAPAPPRPVALVS